MSERKCPDLIMCTGFPTFYEEWGKVKCNDEEFRVGIAINGSALYFFPEAEARKGHFYALLLKDVVEFYAGELLDGNVITEQQAKEQGK